jgi:hypothetical protein
MIWIGGLVLAVVLYMVGPDRFLDATLEVFDRVDDAMRTLVATLGGQAYGVVRALAIAIYAVFVVLALIGSQRGQRGLWALIVVTTVFMLLVWRPFAPYPTPVSRWIGALVLVIVAALAMTQRLTMGPPRRNAPPPYPPGHAP